jgi:amino acid transporter
MIDMIGVGPFITMPLIISAMGGPQAMIGWLLGALLAMCDGMVWAELGAAMPKSGGSYEFLKRIYGERGLGRMLSFLFIFQLSFSAPLSIASGCVGLAQYASYLAPSLSRRWAQLHAEVLGVNIDLLFGGVTVAAVSTLIVAVILLYRNVGLVARIGNVLWIVVMGTIAWIIFAGVTHFNAAQAFAFPPNAFTLDRNFFLGLGGAMLVATYDYWGYYNVCFFGEEIENPERNIPRAMIYSILAVAAIYLVMNISILGVLPWQELAAASEHKGFVVSTMMERLYGHTAGVIATLLIMWTAFASVFSLLLGYSRVPFAAARDGNYFAPLAKIHPRLHIPHVSLLVLAAVAALACLLRLADLIAALVVIRITLQFIVQGIGVILWRHRQRDAERPFKMPFFPVPAVLAVLGFVYVLFSRKGFEKQLVIAICVSLLGVAVYLVRSYQTGDWPFRSPAARGSSP